jgi:hypothetical protein
MPLPQVLLPAPDLKVEGMAAAKAKVENGLYLLRSCLQRFFNPSIHPAVSTPAIETTRPGVHLNAVNPAVALSAPKYQVPEKTCGKRTR